MGTKTSPTVGLTLDSLMQLKIVSHDDFGCNSQPPLKAQGFLLTLSRNVISDQSL